MGFTGKESAKWKEKFIEAFNKMEQQIKSLSVPDFSNPAEAARAWADEYEQKQKAIADLEEAKPKIDFHDKVVGSENSQTMEEVAKTLDWGRNKLFAKLRELKVLRKNNLPYQKFLDRKYFEVKENVIKVKDKEIIKTQTLVTGKGLSYIEKKIK